jgi:hemerythrin-like domain-containing protein
LRAHIEKESDILFNMSDRLIDEKAQSVIYRQFEQHEETVIGHGVHEKFHAMIDSWAEAYGV